MSSNTVNQRVNFASTKNPLEYPDFLEVQLKSFKDFLQLDNELEYFVSPRVAILGRVKQYWSPFSYASKWNTVWNLGVKVLIY